MLLKICFAAGKSKERFTEYRIWLNLCFSSILFYCLIKFQENGAIDLNGKTFEKLLNTIKQKAKKNYHKKILKLHEKHQFQCNPLS